MSKNISSLSSRRGLDDGLFEGLIRTGSGDVEGRRELAKLFLVGEAVTFGANSFYDFLKDENAAQKVFVCSGTACLVAKTQPELHEQLGAHFKEEEIGEICCLGRCYENASFQYDGVNYSGKTTEEIAAIIKEGGPDAADSYRVGTNLESPILTAAFPGIDAYYGPLKEILTRTPDALLEELSASGLRGRGGAGFPAGFKWDACRKAKGEQKYIVCNADEGDPGAYTDRYILEERPHSLLLGIILAGYVVGADTGVVYIRTEYPESVKVINDAVQDLLATPYLGEDICGSGFSFKFKVIEGAGAYIVGEETALLASIEGERAEVRVRPPYPAQEGLFGKPTVVNNVETLACVPFIFSEGAGAFSKIGTEKSTGSKLVSLDGRFKTPGVYEVEMGTSLTEVMEELGGGFKEPVKAVQVGGPLGGVVPASHFDTLTIDFESFSEGGFLLGHGSIICIPEWFPIIEFVKHLFEFCAQESCGKCFPCRLGSIRGQEMMEQARNGDYLIDEALIYDLLDTMESTSLCALGGGVPLPIRNALEYFSDELKPYFEGSSSHE